MLEIFQKGFYWISDAAREIEDGYRTTSKDLGNGLASGLRHVCIVFLAQAPNDQVGVMDGDGQVSVPGPVRYFTVLWFSGCPFVIWNSVVAS